MTSNEWAYEEVRDFLAEMTDNTERNEARAYILGYISSDVPPEVFRRAVESCRDHFARLAAW